MPIVLVTGSESVVHVVDALKAGANDYLQKPVHPDRLTALIRELLKESDPAEDDSKARTRETARPIGKEFEGMLGISPAMQEVFARIARVATTSAPVLIVGESGTGKEARGQGASQPKSPQGGAIRRDAHRGDPQRAGGQ